MQFKQLITKPLNFIFSLLGCEGCALRMSAWMDARVQPSRYQLNPTMTCCSHSIITWQFLADVNHSSFAKSMELIMVPTYNLMLCPDVSHPRVKSRVRRS